MPPSVDLDSTTLSQRLVLLAIAELQGRGETPANVVEVRDCCGAHLDEVAADVLGPPTEVDVSRALNELADAGVVSETTGERSGAGKGRPAYAADVDVETLLDALAGDDQLAAVVEHVRETRG